MHLVRKYHHVLGRFLLSETRRSFVLAWVGLALLLTVAAALLLWMGAPVINGRPADLPILLDGAWRIVNGQVPHRDFYSFLGAFPFYLVRLGMWFGGPGVSAIAYGNVILMVTLALGSMAILARRTSALYALLFSVFLGLLVVAPRPLGDPYDYNDYAMLYNRFGEAFLALFSMLAFLNPSLPTGRRFQDILEGTIMGLCLAILFFIKINYFALAVSFLLLAAVLRFLNVRRGLACLLGTSVFLVLCLAATGIPLLMMLDDCLLMTRAQNTGFRLGILAIHAAKNAWLLPVLLLITWEQTSGRGEETAGRFAGLRPWLLPMAFFAGGLCLIASNCQVGEMPLLALAALCGSEMIRRQSLPSGNDPVFTAGRNLAACCLLLFFLWPTLGTDLKALRNCAFAVIKKDFVTSETLKTTRLRDLRFSPDGTRALYSREYMEFLDEGIQLVRRHQGTEMRLMVALFSDPFNVALG
ncbi:MAG: hypothetical protein NTW03_17030, partial [Verrucomicrobia bacterium]|nr:hypothetical protein [Verrucomicrobiota bacterium]